MRFFLFQTLLTALLILVNSETECVAKCKIKELPKEFVPSSYNKCVCEIVSNHQTQSFIYDGTNFEARTKCSPHYRSLKFRDRATGTVMLHKAVVRVCSGFGNREYVNQSVFDQEEKAFLMERNFKTLPNFDTKIMNDQVSWFDGIRNSIMQLYRKPDSHLRFG